MDESHALMMGMFWGGLLLASVPMLLSLGIGIYVLRRHFGFGGSTKRLED